MQAIGDRMDHHSVAVPAAVEFAAAVNMVG